MALPAKVFWAKLQKELKGKPQAEQLSILRRYVTEWPGWDDIQYRRMREQAEKMLHRLENRESVKSSKGQQDPFHVKRQGDGQICFAGLPNSGKSALISTLTSAHTEVADYPFTTQHPIPGMLEHSGAAMQLVDTPALVSGTSEGEGSGRRLLHLFSTADAAGIVIDLSRDPCEQMEAIRRELSAAQIIMLPQSINTELHPKSKGGIKFTGQPISKENQTIALQILTLQAIAHAEIRIRGQFSARELTAQVEQKHLLPTLLLANKNDLLGAKSRVQELRQAFPDYTIIDVNFLDEAHFDILKDALFTILGRIHLVLLDKPSPDIQQTSFTMPEASTVQEVFEKLSLLSEQVKSANIWGTSVKYDGQEVGLDHVVEEGDMIYRNV